jgi:hypothetical protein
MGFFRAFTRNGEFPKAIIGGGDGTLTRQVSIIQHRSQITLQKESQLSRFFTMAVFPTGSLQFLMLFSMPIISFPISSKWTAPRICYKSNLKPVSTMK